jgi:hypothetical protein
VVCYFGSQLKYRLRIDDALDAFGVHAVGGIVGGILTGFFSNQHINEASADGVFYAPINIGILQVGKQIYAIVVVGLWSCFASVMILLTLKHTMGLRVAPEVEINGLDKKFFREEMTAHHHPPLPFSRGSSHRHTIGEIALNIMHLPSSFSDSPSGDVTAAAHWSPIHSSPSSSTRENSLQTTGDENETEGATATTNGNDSNSFV